MSEYKCKGCQWYNKPYWSIINPCDNCPRENANIEIITRWQDPTIEELKTQLQQKENIIKEVREMVNKLKNETLIEDIGNTTTALLYAKPCCRKRLNKIEKILDKENK